MDRYEFIWKSIQKFGYRLDYREVYDNITQNSKITLICPKHGRFTQVVHNHLSSKHGCTQCGKEARGKSNRDTKESWICKAIKRHGTFYDYSKVNYVDCYTPVTIICPIHGEFKQVPYYHTSENGCPKCGIIKTNIDRILTTENFIIKAREIHGNKYDYSKVDYKLADIKVCIVCPKHGEFWQTAHSHLAGHGCPYCNSTSKGEEFVAVVLDSLNLSYERQYKISANNRYYKLDFYIPSYNIVIEYNGKQHYKFSPFFHKTEDDFLKQKQRDDEVLKLVEEMGFKLIIIKYDSSFSKVKKYLTELFR